jgi:hypothetical protein
LEGVNVGKFIATALVFELVSFVAGQQSSMNAIGAERGPTKATLAREVLEIKHQYDEA